MAATYNRRINVWINGNEVKNDIASIRGELKKLENQQARMDIGSSQYNKLGNEIRKLKGIITEHRDSLKVTSVEQEKMAASSGKVSGMFGKLFSSAASLAGGLGLAVGGMELVKTIFTSTDTLGDKLEETLGGIKTGFTYLAKSVASMDFTNFLANLGDAIKAGREYAKTMDSIADRTRAMGILESKDRNRIAELDIKQKDVTKPKTERIDAAKEILDIEQANADRRMAIAKDTETAELRNASIMTGLTQNRVKELMTLMETNKNLTTEIETYQAAQGEFTSFSATPASLANAKNIINSTSKDIQNASKDLEKFGKLTDEDKDKISQTMIAVGESQAYYNETTKKTQTRMAKLSKGIIDEEEKITEGATVTKNALELVQQAIKDKESELYNAIGKRKPALVEKAGLELKALKELEKTYHETYNDIMNGYDAKAIIEKLTPKVAKKIVKGEKPAPTEQEQHSIDVLNSGQDRQNFNIDQIQQADQDAFAAGETELELLKQKEQAKKDLIMQMAQEASDGIFQIIEQRNQDELNAELSKYETERKSKLNVEGLTKGQIQAINDEYDKKEKEAKKKSWKAQHAADLVQAVVSGALAVLNALGSGGPAAPFLAIAAGIAAGIQVATIAAQKMPEFYEGGFTLSGGSNNKPAGIVHANEYVIPASGVKNPKLRPFLDLLENSRLNGSLPTLNPAVYGLGTRGFADGGYTGNPFANEFEQKWMDALSGPLSKRESRMYSPMDVVQIKVLNKLTEAVTELQKKGVKGNWSLFDLEKIQTNKRYVEKSIDM